MNYIVKVVLVGLLLFFGTLTLGLNTRIAWASSSLDPNAVPGLYIIMANLLGPLYLIYYFGYKSTIQQKSAFKI